MGLLDTVTNFLKKDFKANLFQHVGQDYAPKRDLKGFLLANRGWVYSATTAIADDFSDSDIRLYQVTKQGFIDVTYQQLAPMNVLNNPNPMMTKRDLLWLHSQYIELSGQSFWYVVPKTTGEPTQIIPLLPHRMQVVRSKENIVAGYVYTNDSGTRVPLDVSEIRYFRKPDPLNPLVGGMGTAAAADVSIDTWDYASKWNKNFFYNSAVPAAVLKTEKRLTEEQFHRLKDEFNNQYQGIQNAHKVGLLEAGLEYQKISTDPREMDFRGLKQETRDEILGVFRVPKTVVGITDDVNRANAEATDYVFGKRVIKPRLARFVDALNKFWLPAFKLSGRYEFGFVDPTPSDLKLKYETYEVAIRSGQLTPNEARDEQDKPAVQGGDSSYLPINLTPIGEEIKGRQAQPKGLRIALYGKTNKSKKSASEDSQV